MPLVHIKSLVLPAAFAAVIALTHAAPAGAATVQREFSQNGGSACTGALPTFEGALRKRPKAIGNEGTTTAFITCSAVNQETRYAPLLVWAYFTNRGSASVTVACTMVDGNDFYGSTAFPASKVFTAGQFGIMTWAPVAPLTSFRQSVSLSCALPPGVELNFFNHSVQEDIGP